MSAVKVSPLNETQIEKIRNYLPNGYQAYTSYVEASPGNCILPKAYEKYADKIFNFNIRNDDVFVKGWMKTGTNWTQELVWSVMNYENIDMARKISLNQRVPILESDMAMETIMKGAVKEDVLFLTKFEAMKSPRLFKTHLPFSLLPPNLLDNCKIVSCLRNPKDTFVSLFHHSNLYAPGLIGSLEEFFDRFMNDLVAYSPFFDALLDIWNSKDHPNMCLLFYEDMKRDLAGNIRKVAEFFQRDLPDCAVRDLVDRLRFKKMQKDAQQLKDDGVDSDPMHLVFRKGEIGDWKNHFTEEMNERMDKKIAEKFKDTGLKFTYE